MIETQVEPTSNGPSAIRFVPPSLLRVRHFLLEHGMPIVPWAPAEQVLDEFRELLALQKAESAFWQGVRALLDALRNDLKERLAGDVQCNEVLPLLVRQDLLAEIQQQLHSVADSSGGFLDLVRRVSPPCSVLMLLLGAAVTVGCGARMDLDVNNNPDSGGISNVGGSFGAGGVAGIGGQPNGSGGQSLGTGGSPGCNFTDLQGAIDACGVANASLAACVQTLNTSWRDGLNALLACKTCEEVMSHLTCLQRQCSYLPAEYLEALLSNCYVVPYAGVRLEN